MSVLVDTSVWSHILRRKGGGDAQVNSAFKDLLESYRVRIIGPIRQEILSGIPDKRQYESLRLRLQAFEDIPVRSEDHERAAALFNDCRKRGIQGSHTDFLICAVSLVHGMPIFTLDGDFRQYGKVLDISLYVP